ncbi:8568_t:CDS:2, partial [Racocetra persica]
MNNQIEYEDCRLKDVEQVDNNEINKRVTNIISKMNDRKKQTKEIKFANIPNSNKYKESIIYYKFVKIKDFAKMYSIGQYYQNKMIIEKDGQKSEISKIERKNVKVSSVNDNKRGDKKSEDLFEQNYKANDPENCHRNKIGDSKFGEKCEMIFKVRDMSIDQLNQVLVLIRILKPVDYAEGFVRLNSLSCQHKDAKAGML